MQRYNSVIIKSKRAIRLANYLAAKYKIENLRPSANDSSIEGFKAIAFEIFENLGEVDAIFTFVTSGSSFVGIGRAYQYLLENKEIKKMPRLYAVQSGDVFSVASEFNDFCLDFKHTSGNPPNPLFQRGNSQEGNNFFQAGKFGIKNTRRKKEILGLIKLSGGNGVYVDEDEIEKAKNILENNKISTSPEGCASFAGAIKVNEENKFDKVICVLSGRLRDEVSKIDESGIYEAESFEEVDKIVLNI